MAATGEGALVEAARTGDERAFGQLFDQWFDRVHDLARRIVHDDGIAAEVAQDAFLRAWTKLDTLEDPDAFGGWLLRIARNGALNRLARERRSVATDDEAMTVITDATAPDHDPLAHLDQAGRIALVWDAAAALGERDCSVLDLHLRHGLTAAELADELGTTANNAHQVLFTLRKRLGASVRALVLWRAGRPTCPDLRQGLAAAGFTSFGADVAKAIDRHVEGCPQCSADRTDRISPAALFAAAPIVMAPVLLKANAAHALGEAGVPMAGSTSAGGTGGMGGGSEDLGSGSTGRKALVAAAIVLLVLAAGGVVAVASRSTSDRHADAAARSATSTTARRATVDTTEAPAVSLIPAATVDNPMATTTAPTTAPTTATTVAPKPVIDQFDATAVARPCGDGETSWILTWQTTGADTATIGRTDGKGQPYGPDGTATLCAPYGTMFFINADGPGGTTSATDGGDQPPPTTTQTTIIG